MRFTTRLRALTSAVAVPAIVAVGCVQQPTNHDVGTPAGTPEPTAPPPDGPAFRAVTMLSGLQEPTNVEFAQDGRVWVAEHDGTIQTFDSIDDPTPTLAIDIRSDVRIYGDHGLLGMAIDPQYPARPYLYVQYTIDTTGRWGDSCPTAFTDGCVTGARLERLTLDAVGVATGERKTLVDDRWCYQFSSHAIGDLKFLPDGTLLSGSGEGSSWSDTDYGQFGNTYPVGPTTPKNACGDPPGAVGVAGRVPTSEGGALRAQDLLTRGDPLGWNGSIVRLDPDTGAPAPGNALEGDAYTDDDAIVAHGLRNPYRFTVDPDTGAVLVGDVGWNAYEEIDRFDVHEGFVRNFGWPCEEGPYHQSAWTALHMNLCATARAADAPTKLTGPMAAYWHNHVGAALSGIAVIEPGRYPSEFDHHLAFADYVNQRVYTVHRHGDTIDPKETEVAADGVTAVDLQQAPDGYLYVVDIAKGTVDRLVDAHRRADAVVSASAVDGPLPLHVTFDGSGSTDPTGGGLTYAWDLDGDGAYDDATGATAGATFTTPENVTVGLRVTTSGGDSSERRLTVYPGNTAPVVDVDVTAAIPWVAHEDVTFGVSGTDAEDGALPGSSVTWTTQLEHCATETSCHLHPLGSGTGGGSVEGPSHEYPSYLRLTATATDSRGEATTVSQRLEPAVATLTVRSSPSGAAVAIGSETYRTPTSIQLIKGSDIVVSALSPQVLGGITQVFGTWSDGGARSHSVVLDSDEVINAQFTLG